MPGQSSVLKGVSGSLLKVFSGYGFTAHTNHIVFEKLRTSCSILFIKLDYPGFWILSKYFNILF